MARILIIFLAFASVARASDALPINSIVEERYRDDDLAVVIPQRQQLICRTGASDWAFAFAGFETTAREPIEFEITGSGDYAEKDIFSLAAISLDFGHERTLLGLGKIHDQRQSHPPGWGAGSAKQIPRGNLLSATPTPQRITIDPAKYAPADWDGKLWIGLLLHNVGPKKWLSARIL